MTLMLGTDLSLSSLSSMIIGEHRTCAFGPEPHSSVWSTPGNQICENMRGRACGYMNRVTQVSRIPRPGRILRGYTWVCLRSKMQSSYILNRLQCSTNVTLVCTGNKPLIWPTLWGHWVYYVSLNRTHSSHTCACITVQTTWLALSEDAVLLSWP